MAERNRCDALIVDSNSPMLPYVPSHVEYYTFQNNIGHLSRGGKDGWGRAFCHGLQHAVNNYYDYVAHVECDSVLCVSIDDIVENMELNDTSVASIHVSSMPKWPETGFIVFSVEWLRASNFIERYDWVNRPRRPEPEAHVRDLVGDDMTYLSLRGMRDDFHELTVHNVEERRLDWLTHAPLDVMEKFAGATAQV